MSHRRSNAKITGTCATLLLTFVLAFGFTVKSTAAAPGKGQLTEAQAMDLQKKFEAAQVAGDAATVASLMTDNVTFVHGNMRVQGKSDFVAGVGHGPSGIEGPDRKVILFDGGALVTGPATISINLPGANGAPPTPRVLHIYLSTVWTHTAAGWQVLLSQTTEVPPGPPAGR